MPKSLLRHLIPPVVAAQGSHPDPTSSPPPDRSWWVPAEIAALQSPLMEQFRKALRPPGGGDVRAGVLEDLTGFYGVDDATAVRRALDWEQWSVEEWNAGDRSGPEGLREFYRSTESWGYDLLWYAYLQAEGYAPPLSVVAAQFLRTRGERSGAHLDLGSGVGVTSQLFAALGYKTTLADVAERLFDFARYRLDRRGVPAEFLNLNHSAIPEEAFDVVTAFDVLAHVPDLPETMRSLHRAIRPSGWLLATFDVREEAPETAWHLYDEEWDLCWAVVSAGFTQRARIGQIRCYQRVEPGEGSQLGARLIYRNPVLRGIRRVGRKVGLARELRRRSGEATH